MTCSANRSSLPTTSSVSYRDQNERVAAKLVEVPAEKFSARPRDPSPDEVKAMYDNSRTCSPTQPRDPWIQGPSPDRNRDSVVGRQRDGPRPQGQADGGRAEAAYESRKSEFQERSELPNDLFAGQPELTPPIVRPFADVRTTLAVALAEDKAHAEISDKFAKIKDDVLIPFADQYATALDDIEEAKKQGTKSQGGRAYTEGPQGTGPARGTGL